MITKKLIAGLFLSASAIGGATVPVQSENARWDHSCSDQGYSTRSGFLEKGTYFWDDNGVQISNSDVPCEVREWHSRKEATASTTIMARLDKMTEVFPTLEKKYADVFRDGSDKLYTETTPAEYAELGKTNPRTPEKLVGRTALQVIARSANAEAAIARDATSTSAGSGTSLTYSHTTTGSNTFLAVGAFTQGGVNVNTVTYAGDALSNGDGPRASSNDRVYAWYDTAPNSGANNIVITPAASAAGIQGYSASYTGVGGFDSSGGTNACTTGTTCTVTFTVAANSWTFVHFRNQFGDVTNSTNLNGVTFPVGALGAYDSGGANAGGSTGFVVTVTLQNGSFPTAMSAVSFTAAAGAPASAVTAPPIIIFE